MSYEQTVAKQCHTLKQFSGYYNDGTYEGLSLAVRWWLSNKRDALLKENEDIQDYVLKNPETAKAWQDRSTFNNNSVKIKFLNDLLAESQSNESQPMESKKE